MSTPTRETLAARLRELAYELNSDFVRQAADALDAMAWQPMDTAPKDDSSILAVTSTGVHLIVWWGYLRDADGSPDRAWECASGWPANLIGWQLLPPAPSTGPREDA